MVVTGLGAITPVGNSVPEFWENIVNGVSGAGPITHFEMCIRDSLQHKRNGHLHKYTNHIPGNGALRQPGDGNSFSYGSVQS